MTRHQTPLQLQQQANHWLELQRTGLNKTQQQAFMHWLNESPAHHAAYQETQQVNLLLAKFDDAQTAKVNDATKHSGLSKIWAIAACAALMVISLISYQYWPNSDLPSFHAQYQSARGEQIDFELPDGSQLSLDAQSQLLLVFDAKQRVSQLKQGRALFDIAKDPQRPFIVNTNGANVTVLGTRFSVDSKSNSTRISVDHGRVKVQSTDNSQHLIELVQGQQAVLTKQGVEVQNINPHLVDAWRNGRLVFNNVPLYEVCAEFTRYHDVNFEFTKLSVRNMMISGTFNANELDNFLNLLPHVLPIEIKNNNNHVVMSKN
ncbi:FecR domain-containing protein [Pseudoalteromonas haloplanktis]|uniref:FecR domain-containing protein n=1 Tax=Pseudoalteromonas haloplanktis TaxID=228 RepID=A0ABU1BF10_PSEHA|nr:FecR domain-containing protein [Pseudoalteromonas haloplanktis]MDQ9092114.1 FecR domain-containing protein [Pseudoalteromonas haloplanktis]